MAKSQTIWVESHEDLVRHPKTIGLAQRLGVSLPTAIGHLHLLWHWALTYAQDGVFHREDLPVVAHVIGWEGNPEQLLEALISCGVRGGSGYVDVQEGGQLYLHDWHLYTGRLIAKREADAERKRQQRGGRPVDDPPPSMDRPRDVQRTSSGQARDIDRTALVNRNQEPSTGSHDPDSKAVPSAGGRAREVAAVAASEFDIEYDPPRAASEPTPIRPALAEPPASNPTWAALEAVYAVFGASPAKLGERDKGHEIGILKQLLAQYPLEQLTGCAAWLHADPFYGSKTGIDMTTIKSTMKRYLNRGDPAVLPAAGGSRRLEAFQRAANGGGR